MKSMCSLLRVSAFSILAMLYGVVRADQALVRHAPVIGGTLDGSVQQILGESVIVNGGAVITGDLLVPGTPSVLLNGKPTYGGTVDGTGSTSPSNYQVTLNGSASLRHVIRRTDSATLPTISAPPTPQGIRNVVISSSGQNIGDPATLRNLTLNGAVGQIVIPPGTYGDFTANGSCGFTLGVAGATEPSVYNLQHLVLNGSTQLKVVGPIILTLANGFTANGNLGVSTNPAWLKLNIYTGNTILNGNVALYGYVVAPSSSVTLNGNSQLIGGLTCDRLTLVGKSLLRIVGRTTNLPPAITLTAPVGGAIFATPATITLSATASDADGTVAKVEFFNGPTKLGEATSSPYQYQWIGVASGTYSLTAKATDNLGASTVSSLVTVKANNLPSVTFTTPVNGAILTAPATVALTATATDSDGTIAKVEFFNGSTKLGEATTAPYQLPWTNVPTGSYTLTAKATDNLGGAVSSSSVAIQVVQPNVPPAVSLTAPINNAVFPAPASITFSAAATDSDGTIAKIEFFNGTTKLGETSTAPYQFVWSNVANGTYTLTATATDNAGASTTSGAVTVIVNSRPTAASFSLSTPAGTPVAATLVGTDAEGDALTYAIVSSPSHGSLSGSTPTRTYTPATGYSGSDSFTYTVSDQFGTSAPATVTIQVQVPTVPPTATAAQAEVQVSSSVPFTLNGSDSQGRPLTFFIVSPPSLGSLQMVSVSGQSSLWTYTAGSSAGVDKFTFTVSNGQQTSAPASVKVRVVPVAPVPDNGSGKAGGIVRDATTLQPIEGAVVHVRDSSGAILTDENGQFMIPVVQFGGETAKMVVLEYDAPGYLTTYRRVVAYTDVPVTADPVFLKKYDSKVTSIGSAGGTAINAAGDVQADFPAGSVSGNIPVQLTNYSYGRELPGHLPQASAFTYAVDLAPNGATFSSPVTVRIANVLGFAPNTPIPVGLFNPQTVRWEPESMGTVSADGQWVVCQVTHFSTRDCNSPGVRGSVGVGLKQGNGPGERNAEQEARDPGVSMARGTYEADIDLPYYRSMGQDHRLKLRYESEAAAGRRPVTVQGISGAYSSSPAARAYNIDIAGRNYQSTYQGEPWYEFGSYLGGAVVDLHDQPTGLYPYKVTISNLYPSTYAATNIFGGSPAADTGVATREALAYTAFAEGWLPWVNGINSPYGAGWSINGLSRLYNSPGSKQIMVTAGGADWRIYDQAPDLHADPSEPDIKLSDESVGPFGNGNILRTHRDWSGGLLIAHGDGISRMDVNNTITTIVSGVKGTVFDDGGSGGPVLLEAVIVDAAETESGTIYAIARIDQAEPSSPIQQTGLYRLRPDGSGIEAVALDLITPTEIQIDNYSRIYVYDQATSSIWRYNSNGAREQIVDNVVSVDFAMAFDPTTNRLYFKNYEGVLKYISGEDLVVDFPLQTPVDYIGRPTITAGGEMQFIGRIATTDVLFSLFRYDQDGVLLQRQTIPSYYDNAAVETTMLGKAWTHEYRQPYLRGLERAVPAEILELYVSRGERTDVITKKANGWFRDSGLGVISHYSESGLLLDVKDRNGNATTYTYDSQDRLLLVVDPVGATTKLTYDGNGRLARVDDPAGRSTLFQMDSLGNLVSVTNPDGSVNSYTYDADHHITKTKDRLGQTMAFAVDAKGIYSQITYADSTTTGFQAQRTKSFAVSDPIPGVNRGYDTNLAARLSVETPDSITDSKGNRLQYVLDDRGYQTTETDALGYTKHTFRDSRDRIIGRSDARNGSKGFAYDKAGNVTDIFINGGQVRYTFNYDPLLNLPTRSIDPHGQITLLEYDTAGNLTKYTDALGNATTFTYNSRGQVLTRTNALGEMSRSSYDAKGNPQTATDPLGRVTTFVCDSAGRVTSSTDPLGHTTTLTYDAANRVLSSTAADGATTSFTYDANGNRTSVTDPLGAVTLYTYDSMDQLVKTTAPDGSESRFVYDAMGNRTQTIDPLGNTTTYIYDAANRLVGVTDPLGRATQFELDGNGNKTKTADPLGRVTLTEYDAFNRPSKTTAPDGGLTNFVYDSTGNLLRLTDPLSHVTAWEYDGLNRAVTTTDPLSRTRLTSYDTAGRVATQTNGRGQVLRYTYDVAGRPVSLDLAGTDTITWSYDATGNPLQVADGDSIVTTVYDSLNRPAIVQQSYGTIGYSYDTAGRRSQMTSSAGSVNYIYDSLNRLTGLTDQSSRSYSFAYDLAGRLTRQSFPNNTYSVLGYDEASQLTDKTHHRIAGSTIGDNTYLYNSVGNITGWGSPDGNVRAFTYDFNDRVASAQSTLPVVGNETFAYDKVGNWTPFGGRLHNAANEITDDSGYIYSYDLDGNLVEKASKLDLSDVTTYSWDPLNRLIQVNKGAHVISYRYDGLGRRIAKIVDGVETRYVLDGANVLEERNGANALTAVNLHAGLDRLLMRQDYAAGVTYWAHADHLGSVEALTDASGNVVERYRYTSFGQITVMDAAFGVRSTSPKIPFTYTAREWEPEVGMYFYRARFMDPVLGRFMSQDPLGFGAGDLNYLSYTQNSPVLFTDQLGLYSGIFSQNGGATDVLTLGGGQTNLGITLVPENVSINFKNNEINTKLIVPYEYLTPDGVINNWDKIWPDEKAGGAKKCDVNANAASERSRLDELQHVNDLKDWFNNVLPPLAQQLEQQYAGQLNTNAAKNDIRQQIQKSYNMVKTSTSNRDLFEHRISITGGRP